MDDDDDLIPWNPDHFGHVDFKSENDGQLTIFYEDSHEPPDPDDFPSLEAYEIAWEEWGSKQVSQQPKGEKQMFNFTAPIDNQISELQAKLAELEAQKQLLASRESCANKILDDVEKCVVEMRGAGVDEQNLISWAKSIFSLITGDALPREKLNEAQDELNYFKTVKIEELTKDRDEAIAKITELEKQVTTLSRVNGELTTDVLELRSQVGAKSIDQPSDDATQEPELLKQISDLKVERDTLLERIQELERLNQANAKGIADLSQANFKLCEELNELKGTSEKNTVAEVDAKPLEDPAYLEATKNQEVAAKFLSKIDRKARALAVTWEKLKELPINANVMREIGLAARTKSHQILLDNMPQICATYINETGDKSDFEWLPEEFKNKVEALLETADSDIHEDDLDEMTKLAQIESDKELHEDNVWESEQSKKPTSRSEFKPGDTVIMKNPESPDVNQVRKVLDCHQGWVNVKDDDGNTDLWLALDIELVDQEAA